MLLSCEMRFEFRCLWGIIHFIVLENEVWVSLFVRYNSFYCLVKLGLSLSLLFVRYNSFIVLWNEVWVSLFVRYNSFIVLWNEVWVSLFVRYNSFIVLWNEVWVSLFVRYNSFYCVVKWGLCFVVCEV